MCHDSLREDEDEVEDLKVLQIKAVSQSSCPMGSSACTCTTSTDHPTSTGFSIEEHNSPEEEVGTLSSQPIKESPMCWAVAFIGMKRAERDYSHIISCPRMLSWQN